MNDGPGVVLADYIYVNVEANDVGCTVVVVDPCDSLPCQNEGSCVTDNVTNSYTCKCTDKFTGNNCQLSKYRGIT